MEISEIFKMIEYSIVFFTCIDTIGYLIKRVVKLFKEITT